MDYISIIGIAIGLAMDAFAVSMAKSANTTKLNKVSEIKMALFFGAFQFFMPIIGWTIGKSGEEFIDKIDHWIALVLLGYIGIKMVYTSLIKKKNNILETNNNLNLKTLTILSLATSIDALATGIILPTAVGANTALLMFFSTGLIGIITFLISMIGISIGKKFGILFASKAELVGGLVLVSIGIKIFIEHNY